MIKSPVLLSFLFAPLLLHAQPENNPVTISRSFFIPVEKTVMHRLGETKIPIIITQFGPLNNVVCINLHANEQSSVIAARNVLEERGGTLVQIVNRQQRLIRFRIKGVVYAFDPNRMFSKIGIAQSLKDNGRFSLAALEQIEKFAKRVLLELPERSSCIVALHNNTEEAFSVRSYLPGHERQRDAREVYADSLQDVDDIILTTDSLLYRKMAEHGYNSVWQHNEKAKRDGSLSIFCGERSRRYINIETQHGKVGQYEEMLHRLLSILEEESQRLPTSDESSNNDE